MKRSPAGHRLGRAQRSPINDRCVGVTREPRSPTTSLAPNKMVENGGMPLNSTDEMKLNINERQSHENGDATKSKINERQSHENGDATKLDINERQSHENDGAIILKANEKQSHENGGATKLLSTEMTGHKNIGTMKLETDKSQNHENIGVTVHEIDEMRTHEDGGATKLKTHIKYNIDKELELEQSVIVSDTIGIEERTYNDSKRQGNKSDYECRDSGISSRGENIQGQITGRTEKNKSHLEPPSFEAPVAKEKKDSGRSRSRGEAPYDQNPRRRRDNDKSHAEMHQQEDAPPQSQSPVGSALSKNQQRRGNSHERAQNQAPDHAQGHRSEARKKVQTGGSQQGHRGDQQDAEHQQRGVESVHGDEVSAVSSDSSTTSRYMRLGLDLEVIRKASESKKNYENIKRKEEEMKTCPQMSKREIMIAELKEIDEKHEAMKAKTNSSPTMAELISNMERNRSATANGSALSTVPAENKSITTRLAKLRSGRTDLATSQRSEAMDIIIDQKRSLVRAQMAETKKVITKKRDTTQLDREIEELLSEGVATESKTDKVVNGDKMLPPTMIPPRKRTVSTQNIVRTPLFSKQELAEGKGTDKFKLITAQDNLSRRTSPTNILGIPAIRRTVSTHNIARTPLFPIEKSTSEISREKSELMNSTGDVRSETPVTDILKQAQGSAAVENKGNKSTHPMATSWERFVERNESQRAARKQAELPAWAREVHPTPEESALISTFEWSLPWWDRVERDSLKTSDLSRKSARNTRNRPPPLEGVPDLSMTMNTKILSSASGKPTLGGDKTSTPTGTTSAPVSFDATGAISERNLASTQVETDGSCEIIATVDKLKLMTARQKAKRNASRLNREGATSKMNGKINSDKSGEQTDIEPKRSSARTSVRSESDMDLESEEETTLIEYEKQNEWGLEKESTFEIASSGGPSPIISIDRECYIPQIKLKKPRDYQLPVAFVAGVVKRGVNGADDSETIFKNWRDWFQGPMPDRKMREFVGYSSHSVYFGRTTVFPPYARSHSPISCYRVSPEYIFDEFANLPFLTAYYLCLGDSRRAKERWYQKMKECTKRSFPNAIDLGDIDMTPHLVTEWGQWIIDKSQMEDIYVRFLLKYRKGHETMFENDGDIRQLIDRLIKLRSKLQKEKILIEEKPDMKAACTRKGLTYQIPDPTTWAIKLEHLTVRDNIFTDYIEYFTKYLLNKENICSEGVRQLGVDIASDTHDFFEMIKIQNNSARVVTDPRATSIDPVYRGIVQIMVSGSVCALSWEEMMTDKKYRTEHNWNYNDSEETPALMEPLWARDAHWYDKKHYKGVDLTPRALEVRIPSPFVHDAPPEVSGYESDLSKVTDMSVNEEMLKRIHKMNKEGRYKQANSLIKAMNLETTQYGAGIAAGGPQKGVAGPTKDGHPTRSGSTGPETRGQKTRRLSESVQSNIIQPVKPKGPLIPGGPSVINPIRNPWAPAAVLAAMPPVSINESDNAGSSRTVAPLTVNRKLITENLKHLQEITELKREKVLLLRQQAEGDREKQVAERLSEELKVAEQKAIKEKETRENLEIQMRKEGEEGDERLRMLQSEREAIKMLSEKKQKSWKDEAKKLQNQIENLNQQYLGSTQDKERVQANVDKLEREKEHYRKLIRKEQDKAQEEQEEREKAHRLREQAEIEIEKLRVVKLELETSRNRCRDNIETKEQERTCSVEKQEQAFQKLLETAEEKKNLEAESEALQLQINDQEEKILLLEDKGKNLEGDKYELLIQVDTLKAQLRTKLDVDARCEDRSKEFEINLSKIKEGKIRIENTDTFLKEEKERLETVNQKLEKQIEANQLISERNKVEVPKRRDNTTLNNTNKATQENGETLVFKTGREADRNETPKRENESMDRQDSTMRSRSDQTEKENSRRDDKRSEKSDPPRKGGQNNNRGESNKSEDTPRDKKSSKNKPKRDPESDPSDDDSENDGKKARARKENGKDKNKKGKGPKGDPDPDPSSSDNESRKDKKKSSSKKKSGTDSKNESELKKEKPEKLRHHEYDRLVKKITPFDSTSREGYQIWYTLDFEPVAMVKGEMEPSQEVELMEDTVDKTAAEYMRQERMTKKHWATDPGAVRKALEERFPPLAGGIICTERLEGVDIGSYAATMIAKHQAGGSILTDITLVKLLMSKITDEIREKVITKLSETEMTKLDRVIKTIRMYELLREDRENKIKGLPKSTATGRLKKAVSFVNLGEISEDGDITVDSTPKTDQIRSSKSQKTVK